MDMYTGFAGIYDEFMDNIPYETIVADLLSLMKSYGVLPKSGPVVELGCGTGTITRAVADHGYHVIGVDLSEEMLNVAWQQECEPDGQGDDLEYAQDNCLKMETVDEIEAEVEDDLEYAQDNCLKMEAVDEIETEVEDDLDDDPEIDSEPGAFPLHRGRILYLCQDILELELPEEYSFVFALSDTMNYLIQDGDLAEAFRRVSDCLSKGGRFVFDLKTEYLYTDGMGDQTIVDSREDATLIWENTYDEEEHINEYALTMFQKKEPSGLYEKFEEFHYQRAYTKEEITEAAKKAGLVVEAYFEAYTHKEVSRTTERVYVVLRRD